MSETNAPETAPTDWRGCLRLLGPGIAIAATGVGAGDMVAAAVAGSRYGHALVWAALVGAALKFVLNEGLARWQLATGTTLFEGWVTRLGRWVQWFFLLYLVIWSFAVAGALMSACGLAAHALAPGLSVELWAVIHAVVASAVVIIGGYHRFEQLAKVFIGLMFVTLVGCALLVAPPLQTVTRSFSMAAVPIGGVPFVLGVIGGVGGSVTLLAYGYWIREKGWHGPTWLPAARVDLAVAYTLTGLFGAAVIVLAADVLHVNGISVAGKEGVLRMAEMIGEVIGPFGRPVFLLGFWGAVATSMLGVWQGDPYLFCDFVSRMKGFDEAERDAVLTPASGWYRLYLLWLTFPPMLLLFLGKPVVVIVAYAIIGALFMPFLAATLLYMNSRREWVGELRNSALCNGFLILALLLFAYLCGSEIVTQIAKLAS